LNRGVISILTQPEALEAVFGSQVRFSIKLTANSSTFVNYQWFKNNRPIVGATQRELVLENVSELSADFYYVVVRAGNTEVISQRASLTVGKTHCN
jgi:hypothetical protein